MLNPLKNLTGLLRWIHRAKGEDEYVKLLNSGRTWKA